MKNRLYVFPLARYMLLGITLSLIILMIKGGAEDYSYLNTLEARLPNDPVRVYEELCVYQDKYKFKSNNEQSYFWLLLYKSKKENNLLLPPDSTLINLANRTKDDWAKYSELISNEFPLLMEKLSLISNLTSTERKVCLLMLLDNIGTLEMSTILKLKSSSISSAKKDLYEKLTGLKGSAKNLSQEIINIIAFPL